VMALGLLDANERASSTQMNIFIHNVNA
jgi:hypothetical protein